MHAGSLDQVPLGAAAWRVASDFCQEKDWLRFESLGGGGSREGWEFGLLQRSVGGALSLLSWATIEPEQLSDALERRFEGLGDPSTLSIETHGHYDWTAIELVYHIRMYNTHLDRQTVSREIAASNVRTRLRLLSRKLINDPGEDEKIFLYRLSRRGAGRADAAAAFPRDGLARPISAVNRRRGRRTAQWVQLSRAGAQAAAGGPAGYRQPAGPSARAAAAGLAADLRARAAVATGRLPPAGPATPS